MKVKQALALLIAAPILLAAGSQPQGPGLPAGVFEVDGASVVDKSIIRGFGTGALTDSEWLCQDDGSLHHKEGNARGQTAVDLQLDRAADTEVAQARSSFIGAGEDNQIDGNNIEFGLGYATGGIGGYDTKFTQINGADFEGNIGGWVGGGNNRNDGGYATGFYTSESCTLFSNGNLGGYNAFIASSQSTMGTQGTPNSTVRSNIIVGCRSCDLFGAGEHRALYTGRDNDIAAGVDYAGIIGGRNGHVTASGAWLWQDGSTDTHTNAIENQLFLAFKGGIGVNHNAPLLPGGTLPHWGVDVDPLDDDPFFYVDINGYDRTSQTSLDRLTWRVEDSGIIWGPKTATFVTDGTGAPQTGNFPATASTLTIDCQDPDGCELTLLESFIQQGRKMCAFPSNFDVTLLHIGGQVELPNAADYLVEAGEGACFTYQASNTWVLDGGSGSSLGGSNNDTTVADSGDGSPAAFTLEPTKDNVRITCSDTDGCDATMGEASVADGMEFCATNISANVVNFADTAALSELAGAFAAGQWDMICMKYQTDRWVEQSRSNN